VNLSVVIPVLDEEARIARCLARTRALAGVAEVVVVDGGSRDRTLEVVGEEAERTTAARLVVVTAPRGRGRQLNAGARAAAGDVLLFLHADVDLPDDAAEWVARALAEGDVVGGAFRVHTVADAGFNWLGPLLRVADVRSHVSTLPYGDQAVFVRRADFEAVGGFPDQPLMEDVELANRLWQRGRMVIVRASVQVSGRRFLARPLRSLLAMRLFPLLYRLGVPAEVLARFYGAPR
jgi:rSAM/selenodomain-associated transferase 2